VAGSGGAQGRSGASFSCQCYFPAEPSFNLGCFKKKPVAKKPVAKPAVKPAAKPIAKPVAKPVAAKKVSRTFLFLFSV
jgi:hypothetical protein